VLTQFLDHNSSSYLVKAQACNANHQTSSTDV
jgi:hypothetical protein